MRCKRPTCGKYADVDIRLTHVNLRRLVVQTDERGTDVCGGRESRCALTDNASCDGAIAGQHLAMVRVGFPYGTPATLTELTVLAS